MDSYYFGTPRNEEDHTKFGTLLQKEESDTFSIISIDQNISDIEVSVEDKRSHLLIDAKKNTQSTVFLSLQSIDIDSLRLEIFVEENAVCRIIFLQNVSTKTVSISQKSSISKDASLHIQVITLGGEEMNHSMENVLEGANAMSDVDWVFYAKNSEKHSVDARNVFNAPHGGGEITMKGIAQDTANITCDGMIEIGLQGGDTDAYLTEDVLMLDSTAKVDAIPGLEIKTNDVKASHSATVSQITPADLFYFAARGIPEAIARKMYIEGFLGSITEGMPESIREVVLNAIDAKYITT